MELCMKCAKKEVVRNGRCEDCDKEGLDPKEFYKLGYVEALCDYGIWNNGVQTIGCLNTPVKEIIEKKFGKKT